MITKRIYTKFFVLFFISIGLLILFNTAGFAKTVHSSKVYGVAIDGYDPVAYFTEGRPVKGNSEYNFTWNEAQWHFSKPEHRELFAANPEKYTPKRSGFCAVSLIAGKVAKHNPKEWSIVDGNLYLGWE